VIAKHRYGVYFYGTGETASVKSEDLDPYDTKNVARFNTDRQLKKSEYKEAVDQIQAALDGNDPAPIIPDEKVLKNNNDLEMTSDSIDASIDAYDNSADESQLQIAEDIPKSTPLPQIPKKKPVIRTKIEYVSTPPPEPETKENDEKVSRSGRKIKEKKMNNDEMDPDEMFTQPRKRFKLDEGKIKLAISEQNNAIDEFRASKSHILLDPVKKNLLEIQYEMIHTMQDIKMALGLEQADVDRSIELLESFKEKILPHITDLMILKYPNTVDTVKRLRKYIGNTDKWSLDESEVEQFTTKSQKIREVASEVYEKLKVRFLNA
jgi:Lens epithelium-derived growth factor (LEDGF)